jgi:homocysteine S-methyltransferase
MPNPEGGNPILPFAAHQGVMILDGGLATALEARGCDLNDELWSAKVLFEEPDLIRQVHHDFFAAGADCTTTASYQGTLEGFRHRGLSTEEGEELLRLSVGLALEARDAFWADSAHRQDRLRPLVAASIGPYGAFLADGSEYTGNYGLSAQELREFHEPRWRLLAETDADLLACETIPSATESQALLELLRDTPGRWAWMSFSCRDEVHLSDGTLLGDVVSLCHGEERVAAVGINCTAPELMPPLIAEARQRTDKPILVYPNSGEDYDAEAKVWRSDPAPLSWDMAALEWVSLGCGAVGGCCRVGPDRIARLREVLVGTKST